MHTASIPEIQNRATSDQRRIPSPPSGPREICIGDTVYELTPAYIAGTMAARNEISWLCNPHRHGSQAHDQWNYGHENESAGDHEGLLGVLDHTAC